MTFLKPSSVVVLCLCALTTSVLAVSVSVDIDSVCYGANTKDYPGCSGYAKDGYTCVGDYCAVDKCVGTCTLCAVEYKGAHVNASNGKCCPPTGPCYSGKPANISEPYLYPFTGGGAIFEGVVDYPHGPPAWSPTDIAGSYGFIVDVATPDASGKCPTPPSSFPSSTFPVNMKKRVKDFPSEWCVMGCNMTEVSATGVDPCNFGSFSNPFPAKMGCYSGGKDWISPGEIGVCSYNCTLRVTTKPDQLCTGEDAKNSECVVYCSPPGFTP